MLTITHESKDTGKQGSPLTEQLSTLTSIAKNEAIEQLAHITAEFSTNDIYEASLDLHIFLGIFIRRSLSELSPVEFDEIGNDGSEGKHGLWSSPDSPPPKFSRV